MYVWELLWEEVSSLYTRNLPSFYYRILDTIYIYNDTFHRKYSYLKLLAVKYGIISDKQVNPKFVIDSA